MHHVGEKSFDTFEDIDLREFHAKLRINSEILGADSIRVRNQITLSWNAITCFLESS